MLSKKKRFLFAAIIILASLSAALDQKRVDLIKIVLGDDFQPDNPVSHHLSRFELFRLLRLNPDKTPDLSRRFEGRFEHALRLFTAIIDRTRKACIQKKVKLGLILMPGKSYVVRPGSPSAQFQDYLRKEIVGNSEKMKVSVIDLAILLRALYQEKQGKWFYPNEGHLTAEGHRVVAGILSPLVRKNKER